MQQNTSGDCIKSSVKSIVLVMTIILSGCKQATTPTPMIATETLTATDTPNLENSAAQAVLKTAMGDFLIVSARFVEEVNGVKPNAGEKILLVYLKPARAATIGASHISARGFRQDDSRHNQWRNLHPGQ